MHDLPASYLPEEKSGGRLKYITLTNWPGEYAEPAAGHCRPCESRPIDEIDETGCDGELERMAEDMPQQTSRSLIRPSYSAARLDTLLSDASRFLSAVDEKETNLDSWLHTQWIQTRTGHCYGRDRCRLGGRKTCTDTKCRSQDIRMATNSSALHKAAPSH